MPSEEPASDTAGGPPEDRTIEPLSDRHDRAGFSCGKPPLDLFLQQYAGQYVRKGIAKVYVACYPPSPAVAGYYTLSAGQIDLKCLSESARKRLPRHPVPVILLGRLAVAQSHQKRGLGEGLLMDALQRAVDASEDVAAHAIEVTAIDADAVGFYVKYGFAPLVDDPLHLYLPLTKARQALDG
jgi:GNAT superfamily N-acetyltransferase